MSEIVLKEYPAPNVGRVVLNRPNKGNAQNNQLLYDLDAALMEMSRDSSIRVIILASKGKHFSTGHDLAEFDSKLSNVHPQGPWGGYDQPAQEGYMAFEEESYFGLCWRWRNIPKPVIAEVKGRVIAGGLMLMWVCDLILADEGTTFSDPVVANGVNGVEYFAHPWELGPRKAKEFLFTGRAMNAQLAAQCGMINRVVETGKLEQETLDLATEIANQPNMGLRLAKMAVNQTQDAQGFWVALRSAMGLQHLAHAQHWAVHGSSAPPDAFDAISSVLKKSPLKE